jgi:hypothetical protein
LPATLSTSSPYLRRLMCAPPAPDELTYAIAKRGSSAIATTVAFPYLECPSRPTCFASTDVSVSK